MHRRRIAGNRTVVWVVESVEIKIPALIACKRLQTERDIGIVHVLLIAAHLSPRHKSCSDVVYFLLAHRDVDFIVNTLLHSDFGGILLCDTRFSIQSTI